MHATVTIYRAQLFSSLLYRVKMKINEKCDKWDVGRNEENKKKKKKKKKADKSNGGGS